jgi:hypothetical protein
MTRFVKSNAKKGAKFRGCDNCKNKEHYSLDNT